MVEFTVSHIGHDAEGHEVVSPLVIRCTEQRAKELQAELHRGDESSN